MSKVILNKIGKKSETTSRLLQKMAREIETILNKIGKKSETTSRLLQKMVREIKNDLGSET